MDCVIRNAIKASPAGQPWQSVALKRLPAAKSCYTLTAAADMYGVMDDDVLDGLLPFSHFWS